MSGKVDQSVAESEFERFCVAWDIEMNEGFMAEDDRGAFQGMKDRLIRKIRLGALTVDEEGDPHFTPQFSGEQNTELTFRVPSGADRLAWDKYKDKETVHRIFSTLGAMTGQMPAYFSKLNGRDLKVAEGIALLYLGS